VRRVEDNDICYFNLIICVLYLFIFIAHIIHYLSPEEFQTTQEKDNGNGVSTTVILYNERELREDCKWSSSDLPHLVKKEGYNLWIDLTTTVTDVHSLSDLEHIKQSFCLDEDAIKAVENGSKKPHARILKDHIFTIFLDLTYQNIKELDTKAIYFFLGRGWLITIHSKEIDLVDMGKNTFLKRNRRILASSIDALFYSLLSALVEKYEQLLTAVELKVLEFEKQSQYSPTKKTLQMLDALSKQAIVLRRHFWHARNTISFLSYAEQDNDDVKYLKMVHDEVTQLIDMIESYRDTMNSTREVFAGSVSLRMSDTMRILTVFSVILLPLSFVTGIFSMSGFDLENVSYVPGGFSVIAAVLAAIAGISLLIFWKRGWIFVREGYNVIDTLDDDNNKKKR
jgi:magnesium transporter